MRCFAQRCRSSTRCHAWSPVACAHRLISAGPLDQAVKATPNRRSRQKHTLAALGARSYPTGSEFWRVRLVVRTQPSQGWCTGSTPVRAAMLFSLVKSRRRGRWPLSNSSPSPGPRPAPSRQSMLFFKARPSPRHSSLTKLKQALIHAGRSGKERSPGARLKPTARKSRPLQPDDDCRAMAHDVPE
jgi:hypothetical protein